MKLIKFLSIAFVLSIAFLSCSEDDTVEAKSERLITDEETRNQQNEYDSTGKLHNEFLDYFINRSDLPDEINQDYLIVVAREFASQNEIEYNPDETIKILDFFQRQEVNNAQLGRAIDFPYPSSLCEYFPSLCASPFNPFPTPDFPFQSSDNNTDNVLDYINRTKEFEKNILQSDLYNDDQKRMILQSSSVGRYSHQYWHNQEVKGIGSSWYSYMEEAIILAMDCPTCEADIAGAVVGSTFGPWGALIGGGLMSAVQVLTKE